MKYTLVLGIQYKKYKEGNGQISLRVGDRFIESFKLESDYGSVANIQSLMKKAEKKRFKDEVQQSKWLISEAKKIMKKEKIDFRDLL